VRKHQAMEKEDRVSENERTNNEDLLLYRYWMYVTKQIISLLNSIRFIL
jgi:hypothetical protein